ncbi:MAG: gamma-glutamylcyclotransferase [Planctomycetota bacterium]|jgi:gamma-glutamylcyclotransferase
MSLMNKLLYFAFGSNLHPLWLKSRTPSAVILSKECITHFKLDFNKFGLDDSGKCNIVKTESANDLVHGVVYQFNADEKDVLDEAERGYSQEIMQIGEYENVLVYVAEETTDNYSSPFSWYQDIVIAGARMHDFSESYIDHIQSFNAISDPDQARENRLRAIVWPGG